MKKHAQHHVWKAYLRAWATKDRLAVLQAGHIRPSENIKDVGNERHFYKLHLLTDADIDYIRKIWIAGSPKHMRPLHECTLQMFAMPPRIRAQLTEEQIIANPDFAKELDEWIINGEEDYHSTLETDAAPFIDQARNGDIASFDDPKTAAQIAHFIALQHFRTTMRYRVIASFKEKFSIDIGHCWNVISHIFAGNLGRSLYADRKRSPLRLLTNDTPTPFITSDQPTVNVLGGGDFNKPPEHFALHYPISPHRALLLDDADRPCGIADTPITEDVVQRLNGEIARFAGRQVFASSPQELIEYQTVTA